MDALRHLDGDLGELDAAGLLRRPRSIPAGALVLCSNDYLGLAAEPIHAADGGAAGAGASRLISGDCSEHRALERTLAAWVGLEDALLFSSGFAANVGVIPALARAGDLIVSDALNHASIIDGCRASRARVAVVEHGDIAAVERVLAGATSGPHRGEERARRWVVTESYFSMDGDGPDLRALRKVCDAHDAALCVDEAHALGVFGAGGRGRCHEAGVVADVLVGTLSKSVGLMGGFVAGSAALRSWLWNRARSFVFSTGMSPWLARAAERRVAEVIAADAARERLRAGCVRFRQALAEASAPIAPSFGPIVPWIIGDAALSVRRSDELAAAGIFVQAIRPPTVPAGQSRLRITLHAKLSDADLDRALGALCGHRSPPRSPDPAG